jgi:hypothetical protein
VDAVDVDALRSMVDAFRDDDQGGYAVSPFTELLISARVSGQAQGLSRRSLHAIHADLTNLRTLVFRTHWMAAMRDAGHLHPLAWAEMFKSDVSLLHVEARSLLDHLAVLIGSAADKRGSTPESFKKLQTWAGNEGNASLLGSSANLVVDAAWFVDLRTVRDGLVHKGWDVVAFLEPGDITFQVHDSALTAKIVTPAVLRNNIVDFKRYAPLLVARLMALLEPVSMEIARRFGLEPLGIGDAQSRHPGLLILRDWAYELLAAVDG